MCLACYAQSTELRLSASGPQESTLLPTAVAALRAWPPCEPAMALALTLILTRTLAQAQTATPDPDPDPDLDPDPDPNPNPNPNSDPNPNPNPNSDPNQARGYPTVRAFASASARPLCCTRCAALRTRCTAR